MLSILHCATDGSESKYSDDIRILFMLKYMVLHLDGQVMFFILFTDMWYFIVKLSSGISYCIK